MDDIELLRFQMKGMERNILMICKDLNERMNRIEDKVKDISDEADKLLKELR